MSYRHYFYALDLSRLTQLFGSNDEEFIEGALSQHAGRIRQLDISFPSDDATFDATRALRDIVAGKPRYDLPESLFHIYGYVLEFICEIEGELLMSEAYSVRDMPFESILESNGPPIPIPVSDGDWPQMGHLRCDEISSEIRRIEAVPSVAELERQGYRRYGNGDAAAGVYDMQDYKESLEKALKKRLCIVSFRG